MSKNADLHKRRQAAIPRGVGNSLAVYADRAQNAELVKILSDATITQRLGSQGLDPAPGTPAELAAYMRAETARFSKIIKLAGLGAAQ